MHFVVSDDGTRFFDWTCYLAVHMAHTVLKPDKVYASLHAHERAYVRVRVIVGMQASVGAVCACVHAWLCMCVSVAHKA